MAWLDGMAGAAGIWPGACTENETGGRGKTMFLEGLDELDQRIVRLLIENARMSYSDIGQQVGISRVAGETKSQGLGERGRNEE